MLASRAARWPWLVTAAVATYLTAGALWARCPSFEFCWDLERRCDTMAREDRYACRGYVRGCFTAWEKCSGGAR